MTERITVYRKLNEYGRLGPTMSYFYLTEVGGRPWVAEVEAGAAEGWGEFEWTDQPPGQRIKSDAIAYLSNAHEIGYIEDQKLHITQRWQSPVHGYDGSGTVIVWNWFGAPE